MIERELEFTDADMATFAEGSGDVSPLHTDQAFAERTTYGTCIVYGGLLSIAMLGTLPAGALASIRSVRSSFPAPVLPNAAVSARAAEHPSRAGTWEVRLLDGDRQLARLVATTERDGRADTILARTGVGGDPIDGPYTPGAELSTLADRFGAGGLEPALLDGVGWASYLVGMGMSGFDGLCAAVDLTTGSPGTEAAAQGTAQIRDHDPRTERRLLEGVLRDERGAPRTIAQIECFPISVLERR